MTSTFKVPLFTAEREFVDALMAIGERMRTLPTKDLKSTKLQIKHFLHLSRILV